MVADNDFDPIAFVLSVLPDMNQWAFCYDGVKEGMSGIIDYLNEGWTEPVPDRAAMPLIPPEDQNLLAEFFPDMVKGGSLDYSPSSYGSSTSSYVYPDQPVQPIIFEEQEVFTTHPPTSSATSSAYYYPEHKVFEVPPPHQAEFEQKVFENPGPSFENAYSTTNNYQWINPISPSSNHRWVYPMNTTPVVQTPPYTPVEKKTSPPRQPLAPVNKYRLPKQDEICSNCKTKESSMWRWNTNGDRECNACNLYQTHNNRKRPPELWKEKPGKRRKRNPKQGDKRRVTPY